MTGKNIGDEREGRQEEEENRGKSWEKKHTEETDRLNTGKRGKTMVNSD